MITRRCSLTSCVTLLLLAVSSTACDGGSDEGGAGSGATAGTMAGTTAGSMAGEGTSGAGAGMAGTVAGTVAGMNTSGEGGAGIGAGGTPVLLTGISAGSRDACGVGSDGTLWCWGDNTNADLVGAPGGGLVAPQQVGVDTDWAQVVASGSAVSEPVHHCGIKTSGDLVCWGDSGFGSVGVDLARGFVFPPLTVGVSGPWTSLSTYGYQVCGISQGKLYCWGSVAEVATARNVPEPIGTDSDWKIVASGLGHACGLKTGGTIHCWGSGKLGQLGQGGAAPTVDEHLLDPVQVGADSDYISVGAGKAHACALKSGGTIQCWGSSSEGAMGGAGTMQTAPMQAGDKSDWAQLFVGGKSTCAINQAKQLWCWGAAASYAGGAAQPAQLGSDHAWRSAAVGLDHVCAVTETGETYCAGDNAWGQLGDPSAATHAGLRQVTAD
jgi:hypothetical protein